MNLFLDISTIINVSDINNLKIEMYEAAPMISRGWTELLTDKSIIGYMDEIERIRKLSIHPKSKFLFRADGPNLYYAKLRVVREVCKKCRNEAYKGKEHGRWDKDCLANSWFANSINPIRPKYGDLSTVYCPGPVVNKWINEYMVPKIYNILLSNNKIAFSDDEIDMIIRGDKYRKAMGEYQKIREAEHSEIYEQASMAAMDADVFNRIGIKVDSPHYTARDCIIPPPIWCPYKEEHKGI